MNVLTTMREAIAGMVGSLSPSWPTLLYLPGNVEQPPCFVVGRPRAYENAAQRALVQVDVPVYILGRTASTRDDDSQRELDAVADQLLTLMWKPPKTESLTMRLTAIDPTVVPIGSTDWPAYTATVVCTTTFC